MQKIEQAWSWLGGKVTAYGLNLPGVLVTIGSQVKYTDENGNFGFQDLTPGTYIVTFSKEGYWDKSVSKRLLGGENNVDVSMTPTTRPNPRNIAIGLLALTGIIGAALMIRRS